MQLSAKDGTVVEIFQMQAELCRSLGDAKRLMILHELGDGERSVGKLSESLSVSQSNMSQHLSVLRKVGLVTTRRQGSAVYYRLANPRIMEACEMVRRVLVEQMEGSQALASRINSL
jgi:ArsR family transcriptional regulator